MEHNQIRNLLHLIQLTDLTPAQIEAAMGGIFLSENSIVDQNETVSIVKAVQAVKTPTLGALIPNTCVIVTRTADSGILPLFTPVANKSYVLYAADVHNTGVNPGVISIGYTDPTSALFVTLVSVTAQPTGITAFPLTPVFFDSGVPIAMSFISGTAADHAVSIVYGEVVQ